MRHLGQGQKEYPRLWCRNLTRWINQYIEQLYTTSWLGRLHGRSWVQQNGANDDGLVCLRGHRYYILCLQYQSSWMIGFRPFIKLMWCTGWADEKWQWNGGEVVWNSGLFLQSLIKCDWFLQFLIKSDWFLQSLIKCDRVVLRSMKPFQATSQVWSASLA